MKSKGKVFARIRNIFKSSGLAGCRRTQMGSGSAQETNIFPGPVLDHRHECLLNDFCPTEAEKTVGLATTFLRRRFALSKPKKRGSVRILSDPSFQIDLDDDDGLSDFLTLRHENSLRTSNPTLAHLYRTSPYLPEIQTDSLPEVGPFTPYTCDNFLSFQYSVATSNIPLECLFKQSHVRINQSLWNTLLVPCDPSRNFQDPAFNVRILVPLLPGHSASQVNQTMQVGVFYCHRSILTSQSSYFRDILVTSNESTAARGPGEDIDIVALTSASFSVETLKITLDFMYNVPRSGDLICSEPLLLYKTVHFLGLSFRVKRITAELIIQKILHRTTSEISIDSTEHVHSLRRSWTNPIGKIVCRCSTCAHFAPQVLLLSLEYRIKDAFLERAARQTLVESFGIGWCTSEFAALPHEIMKSISDNLLSVITPKNSLSILFATEEALSALQQSPLPSPSIKAILLMTRTTIDGLILENPGSCFDCPEWLEMSDTSSAQMEKTRLEITIKLGWISDTINRIKQTMDLGGDRLEYLDRLRHLVAERQLTATYQRPSSPSFCTNEDRVSEFINSPASYQIRSELAPIVNPLSSEPPATRLISSSLYSNTQGSVESLPYSYASSRTASTDYGLFYTRLGLSPPVSLFERPMTPPTVLMSPRLPQPRTYQRSPLGIFSSNTQGNSFDLSITPYSVPVATSVFPQIDSPPPISSTLKSAEARATSPNTHPPTIVINQPPAYALIQQREDNSSNTLRPIQATELPIANVRAEDQVTLEHKISELQSTSVKLQEALVRHEASLKEAFDRLEAYQGRTNTATMREQALHIDSSQDQPSQSVDILVTRQTVSTDAQPFLIQDISLSGPSEGMANGIGSRSLGGERGMNQVNNSNPANTETATVELIMENVINLCQSVTDGNTDFSGGARSEQLQQNSDNSIPSGPTMVAFSQTFIGTSSSEASNREKIKEAHEEMAERNNPNPEIPTHMVESPTAVPGHSVPPVNVEKKFPFFDNSDEEEGITQEFYQLDEYLACFEERINLYKSACEERISCSPNMKSPGAFQTYGLSRQEIIQQREVAEKLDAVLWRIKEGRKNLTELCFQIRDDYNTSRKREHVENAHQEDQLKYLEHVLVSLLRKRSSKKRAPRLTRWRDTDVYGTRKSSERKWRSRCAVEKW